GPAQHLGNQVFEACRRYFVVRVVDQGIGVEPRIGHHAVDEVIYDGRDAVDTAEPLVKVGRILRGHWRPLLLPHSGKVDSMARSPMSTRDIAATMRQIRAASSSPARSVASSASSSANCGADPPAVIGHIKTDGHLGRCYLKGRA